MSEGPSAAAVGWVVLGTGGHARSVCDVIRRRGDRLVAVAGPEADGWGVPVLTDDDEAFATARREGAAVVVAIGDNAVRRTVTDAARRAGADVVPLLASTATVSGDARLGAGVQVLEHAHVGPGAVLGDATVVNTAAVVEHDVVVGVAAHVAPRAVLLGAAAAGDLAVLGSGAVVLPGVHVGEQAVVGAGAVVREDVPAGRTVVGVPARPPHA